MRHLLEIAQTGLASVRLHPLRSLVCVVALVAVLLPFLVGQGLAKGIESEAEASAQFGADVYVAGRQFGRPVPVPLSQMEQVRKIDSVTAVVPRIVGEVVLGTAGEHAVLVGLPPEQFAAWTDSIDGAVPHPGHGNELVVGSVLAHGLGLHLGSVILPFYHNNRVGDRNSVVVGMFKPDAPLWQARLILTSFETAAAVFDQPGLATDLLVSCRRAYQGDVSRAIEDLTWPAADGGLVHARATSREELLTILPHGVLHREGVFTLHFVLFFVAAILVLLVASGLGLAERRREVGILKATGWQTDEVLLRAAAESLCLALAAATLALLLAWVWLRLFNGFGIAAYFLAGAGTVPEFRVPFYLTPVPALLAFVLALVIVLSGTLFSSWRAATAAPLEAIR